MPLSSFPSASQSPLASLLLLEHQVLSYLATFAPNCPFSPDALSPTLTTGPWSFRPQRNHRHLKALPNHPLRWAPRYFTARHPILIMSDCYFSYLRMCLLLSVSQTNGCTPGEQGPWLSSHCYYQPATVGSTVTSAK